jgi:transposase-like protein
MNKRLNKFSPEVRERAVRMVQEHRVLIPNEIWAKKIEIPVEN